MTAALRSRLGVAIAALAGALLAALPGPAAADEKSACIDAHVRAQELRQSGQLRAARERLMTCAADACPPLVKRDCAQWVGDVGAAIPSVVVEARDARGKETVDVEVLVDGDVVAERLDGRAIEIDPGEHVFRFRAPGGATLEQRTVIREGERRRSLLADFQPPAPKVAPTAAPPHAAPAPEAATSRGGSVLPYVLGGVAIAATGSFVTFAILGKNKESELEDLCVPNCSLDDVGTMRTRYLVADISLGAAVVAGGLAIFFALSRPSPTKAARAQISHVGPARGGISWAF